MSLMSRLKEQEMVTRENKPSQLPNEITGKFQEPVFAIHREVIKEIGVDLSAGQNLEQTGKIEQEVRQVAESYLEKQNRFFTKADREEIIRQVMDEVIGYGPITPLLKDETVSEVMVNGPYQIFVERRGKLELTPVTFRNNEHLYNIIERIIAPLGRRIDESVPMVDGRLPDGSRVNAIIPPLALNGCILTIRKFSSQLLKIEDLIRNGTLTLPMAKFLEGCVKGRLNIVVSGGTGAGKTSTLNIISAFIPPDERIVTIEDSAELDLNQEHVISLETRPANIEQRGEITIRDLVRNSLRMRPDRLVVGEVRGGEALDMLQAMNTGHLGFPSCLHCLHRRNRCYCLRLLQLPAPI
jgi:pilus assembly protein CpaF